ncbi:MAG: hypothetical protein ACK4KT_01785 [Thermaurantimonas sp.]
MKKLLIVMFILIGIHAIAQPGMPNNPTPIDGISGLLLVTGAAIGISRYRSK